MSRWAPRCRFRKPWPNWPLHRQFRPRSSPLRACRLRQEGREAAVELGLQPTTGERNRGSGRPVDRGLAGRSPSTSRDATHPPKPTAALVNSPVEALADQAVQATAATMKAQSPVEIGETTPVPTEAIAATSVPLDVASRPHGHDLPGIRRDFVASAAASGPRGLAEHSQPVADHGRGSHPADGRRPARRSARRAARSWAWRVAPAAKASPRCSWPPLESFSSQGRKVVLVDANWSNPQLAQSLGLLPQIGWEETLCGGLPLEEVVIESLADGLAVLPVREPSASTIATAQIAASFDILAREFDVVLVDLGPLAQVEDEDASPKSFARRGRADGCRDPRAKRPRHDSQPVGRGAPAPGRVELASCGNHPELCRRVSHHV